MEILQKEGFIEANDLIELGEEDARDLAKDIGMGRGHTVRLVRWIKEQSTLQEGTNTHPFQEGGICKVFSVLLH